MEPTRRLPPGVTIQFPLNTFQIQIMWTKNGWAVAYPVIPEHEEPESGAFTTRTSFHPGQTPQFLTMPLDEFLNMLAEEYRLRKAFIAYV